LPVNGNGLKNIHNSLKKLIVLKFLPSFDNLFGNDFSMTAKQTISVKRRVLRSIKV